MATRAVRIWPDPILSRKTQPVATVDATTRALVADLFDTMYAENGIGLAANQIGVDQRVLVIDLDPHKQADDDAEIREELDSWGYTGPQAFINPSFVPLDPATIVWEEGCLSVPGITDKVTRKAHIKVSALGPDGNSFSRELHGLYSVALQHELDHLNGRVFVDYLSRLKRDGIKRKMLRLKGDAGKAAGRRDTPEGGDKL